MATLRVGEPMAWVGGRLATDLVELTDDWSRLDSGGWWAVVADFEGTARLARFAQLVEAPLPSAPWQGPPQEAWRSSMDRDAYVAGVASIRDRIAEGEVYQANLCRVLEAPLAQGADLLGLATTLARAHPAPYAAFVRLPGLQVACASPELYLRRDGQDVESGPIKGTAVTPAGLRDKDVAENVMIVDMVRNDLGRVCETGSVEVAALCDLEEHPGLVHLVSRVRGRLRKDAGWAELAAATLPAASVTGAPRRAAAALIAGLEPTPRGPYCGAVGWVDADRRTACLAVAIRTFWAADGVLRFGTGAGITWGSDPVAEWDETVLKATRLVALASAR